jgi:hypothetical protein
MRWEGGDIYTHTHTERERGDGVHRAEAYCEGEKRKKERKGRKICLAAFSFLFHFVPGGFSSEPIL